MCNKNSKIQTEAHNNYDFSLFSIHHKSFLSGVILSAIILVFILGFYFYKKNKTKYRMRNGDSKRQEMDHLENQHSSI